MDTTKKDSKLTRLAVQLAEGLQHERAALGIIKTHLDRQLQALRQQDREEVQETTLNTSQKVNSLQQLRTERDEIVKSMAKILNLKEEKTRLQPLIIALASELKDKELKAKLATLAAELPEEAASIKDSCKELAYSLQYALHLGQSLIEAIHGAASPPPVQIYTARGNKELTSNRRMMVNKVG